MLPTQHIQATAPAVCAAFRFDTVVHDRSVFFLPVSEMATDGNLRCGQLRRRFS